MRMCAHAQRGKGSEAVGAIGLRRGIEAER
jgi:hypothetical protein